MEILVEDLFYGVLDSGGEEGVVGRELAEKL